MAVDMSRSSVPWYTYILEGGTMCAQGGSKHLVVDVVVERFRCYLSSILVFDKHVQVDEQRRVVRVFHLRHKTAVYV